MRMQHIGCIKVTGFSQIRRTIYRNWTNTREETADHSIGEQGEQTACSGVPMS